MLNIEKINLYDEFGLEKLPERAGNLTCIYYSTGWEISTSRMRPAVLIMPGGGYHAVSDREAEPIALRFANRGYAAFVLRYSVKPNVFPTSLRECAMAMKYIRENCEKFEVDPNMVAAIGFSAGGHLALSAGLLAENKPNAMILGYPAVQVPNLPGADYLLKVLTGKQTVTDQDSKDLSLVDKITKEAPPVFLVATAEDYLTSFGALPVVNRYSQLGLPYEAHIFQHGPHGYSTAAVAAANGSEGLVNDSVAHWLQLSVDWMMRIFGKPVLTNKNVSEMAKHLKEMGITLPGA